MRSRNFLSGICVLMSVSCLLIALSLPAVCRQSATFTQRRINETAAMLERARRALLETPHLRQEREGWPDYIRRITAPLPGEANPAYRKRLEGYLAALTQAADTTANARQMPALRDNGEANRKLWTRVNEDLSSLPERLARLKALIKQAAAGDRKAGGALGTEMNQMLQTLIEAQNALRDARP